MDLEALIRSHRDELTTRLSFALSGDRHAAEDLAQEAFTRAWRSLPEGLTPERQRAWLKRTKHKCDHAGDDEQGGSLQGVEIDQCNLDETILRTVYLRGLK